MASNRTIDLTVCDRVPGSVGWRLHSTYQDGTGADTQVRSLDEVWAHAASQGLDRRDVKFAGNTHSEMLAADLTEFRNEVVCPSCRTGKIIFDPSSVVRTDDNIEWFTIEAFDHADTGCTAQRWAWHRVKNVVTVAEP